MAVALLACSTPPPTQGGAAGGGAGRAAGEAQGGGLAAVAAATLARVALPDGRVVLAEVASTPAQRARGLMFRDKLSPGEGMVFIFPEPGIHSFWMKNTLIPLDIVWLDAGGQIVHLAPGVPPCAADPCPSVVPIRPSAWVLEVAAGEASGLRLGDRLLIAPEPSAAPSAAPVR